MRRHRTDPVSLVVGLVLTALAGWWLLVQVTDAVMPAIGWLTAGALVVFGVLGLVANVRAGGH